MNGDILSDLTSALIGGLGLRAQRQHRQRGRDLRGRARLGAQVRRQGRDQPHRGDPVGVLMLRYLGLFERGRRDRACRVRDAGVRGPYGRRGGLRPRRPRPPPTPRRSSGTSARRTETWTIREPQPLQLPELSPDPDYVKVTERGGGGLGRVRRVPVQRRGTRRLAHRARDRDPTGAEDDLQPRDQGLPRHRARSPIRCDHWRCRFIIREDPGDLWDEDVHQLLARISRRHTWMHIEKLQEFDGELGLHPGPGRELS